MTSVADRLWELSRLEYGYGDVHYAMAVAILPIAAETIDALVAALEKALWSNGTPSSYCVFCETYQWEEDYKTERTHSHQSDCEGYAALALARGEQP